MAAVIAPLQIVAGDLHGLNTLEHQPQKVAAMEANWETQSHAPLVLFAIPDEEAQENRFEIAIPSGASLILKHDPAGVVPGLDEFEGEHPPVAPVFFAFRVMVGVGFLMLGMAWLGAWQLWRRGDPTSWLARGFVAMTFSGWVATLAGWYTTEIGRQPWLVSGVLKTSDAVGSVAGGMVGLTLAVYLTVYALLLATYVALLFQLARQGRRPAGPDQSPAIGAPACCSRRSSDHDPARRSRILAAVRLRRPHGIGDPRLRRARRLRSRRRHSHAGGSGPRAGSHDRLDRARSGMPTRPGWCSPSGLLLVAFPIAHGMILQALYLPVFVMLVGLIVRGVAFEFRAKVDAHRKALLEPALLPGLARHGAGAGLDARPLHHGSR